MRIMRRALGLTALVAAALILTSGALRASDGPVVHVKAVVKNGTVTLEARGERPVRIHHLSPKREPLCARSERGVGSGPGRSADGGLRLGEELPHADLYRGEEARGTPGNPAEPGCGAAP